MGAAIVRTVTAVLQGNAPAKESLAACAGYQKLFEALKSLGQPTADIIRSVVAMARDVDIIDDDSDESVAGGSDENLVCFISSLFSFFMKEIQYGAQFLIICM